MRTARHRDRKSELRELAQKRIIDGTFVRARCYIVDMAHARRYEIWLDGGGERAVLDLVDPIDPIDPRSALREVSAAMEAFAGAVKLRAAPPLPIPRL